MTIRVHEYKRRWETLENPKNGASFLAHLPETDEKVNVNDDGILEAVIAGKHDMILLIFSPGRGHANTQKSLKLRRRHTIGAGRFEKGKASWQGYGVSRVEPCADPAINAAILHMIEEVPIPENIEPWDPPED